MENIRSHHIATVQSIVSILERFFLCSLSFQGSTVFRVIFGVEHVSGCGAEHVRNFIDTTTDVNAK